MQVDVVDENDNVIGQTSEYKSTFSRDKITRGTGILVFNTKGELFLQKRKSDRYRYPLHWDCSAGGGVFSGEDVDKAAARELKEELSIDDVELKRVIKKIIKTDKIEMASIYKVVTDKDPIIDKSELAGGQFFSLDEIKKMIKNGEKLSPFFVNAFNTLYS